MSGWEDQSWVFREIQFTVITVPRAKLLSSSRGVGGRASLLIAPMGSKSSPCQFVFPGAVRGA